MKRIIVGVALLVIGFTHLASAQNTTGEIRGKVFDDKGKPVDLALVVLKTDSVVVRTVNSDENGDFYFSLLLADTYHIQVRHIGFQEEVIKSFVLNANQIRFLKVILIPRGALKSVTVIAQRSAPVIDPSVKGGIGIPMTLPTRNVNNLANLSPGVLSVNGGTPTFRGARADGTAYYVDGIRVIGSSGVPANRVGGKRKRKPVEKPVEQNTEEYRYLQENQFAFVKVEPLSTFSIDVDRASYSMVRRFLNNGTIPPADAVRVEEMINYFSYDYPAVTDVSKPFQVFTEVSTAPWEPKHKLVKIALKAKEIDVRTAPANNLVFLIDVSGSMESPDKLPLVQESLNLLVKNLREQDNISIVVYAGSAGLVLDATPGHEKRKIEQAINNLRAGGSTAGGAGINLAYAIAKKHLINGGNNRVILATDGDFNVGVSSEGELTRLIEEKRGEGIFLTVLGFGTGNYKDNRMEQLADKGNGNYAYIDNINEARKVLIKEMGGTLYVLAKDVKLQVEFNPKKVTSYRLIGYENRMMEAVDFNNDKKDAGELGAGHEVTALYEIILIGDESKESVDALKYQQNKLADTSLNDLLTVKVRYKLPDATESTKMEFVVNDNSANGFEAASENMRFAVAVAGFAMKMRGSAYVKNTDCEVFLNLAKSAQGSDENGYRKEFINMVQTYMQLANR